MGPANLIDGRALARQIHDETVRRIADLRSRGINPGLAFVRVGNDPASKVYVGMKEKRAAELGVRSVVQVFPPSITLPKLLDFIAGLNADPAIHAILVQAPLPSHLDPAAVYSAVSPAKDVDGFHPLNAGKLLLGDSSGFVPCTPAGVHQMLVRTGIPMEGADVVILGRGNIVGKPLAALLVQKTNQTNCTVTIAHRATRDLPGHCRRADILVAAMGSPEFVKADMVKPGAVVVDVGVNRVADSAAPSGYRLVGDVAFEEVRSRAGWITPNPGGVGPMTIAMLMANTARAAESLIESDRP